ncbi:EAL domain-containing protein [candidate division WOR-3 bacterium]|nr:EAL domain-containing protein [candidate division WOR-3 bacterium]
MPSGERILIVNDDPSIVETISSVLKGDGFTVSQAFSGKEGLAKVYLEPPELIILDAMVHHDLHHGVVNGGQIDGYEVCRRLKNDPVLGYIPIILLTARLSADLPDGKAGWIKDKTAGMKAGADDYMIEPFDLEELLLRVKMILYRSYYALDANPLTRLPGNYSIVRKMERCLRVGALFAVCYIDLNGFKLYNDKYGFLKGDELLKVTADVIIEATKKKGNPGDFIGHIGGDDFIVITTPEKINPVCANITERFDTLILNFYSEKERKERCFTFQDRYGNLRTAPLLTISIVAVHNKDRKLTHIGQINAIASELKELVKSLPGSNYIKSTTKGKSITKPFRVHKVRSRTPARQMAGGLQGSLKKVIYLKQINTLFQPILYLPRFEIFGYEALSRGPAGTSLESPRTLFELARKENLLLELEHLCIEKALLKWHTTERQNLGSEKLFLNINPETIEPLILKDKSFICSRTLQGSNIVFEIAERHLKGISNWFPYVVEQLKKRRFKIAIDNVGSTQMDKRLIAKLMPNFVKLDISLIKNIDKDTSKHDKFFTLLKISQNLGTKVIAEGVETKEERVFLLKAGVHLIQGHLLAYPREYFLT